MHVPFGTGVPNCPQTNTPPSHPGLKIVGGLQHSIVWSPQAACGTQQAELAATGQSPFTDVK
jgi:hypothetical protein